MFRLWRFLVRSCMPFVYDGDDSARFVFWRSASSFNTTILGVIKLQSDVRNCVDQFKISSESFEIAYLSVSITIIFTLCLFQFLCMVCEQPASSSFYMSIKKKQQNFFQNMHMFECTFQCSLVQYKQCTLTQFQ